MTEAERTFEPILQWLRSNLGANHLIVTLYDATCNFVSNLLRQPFVPRFSAISQLENFVKSRNCGSVFVYAPAGFGKTTFLANWAIGVSDGVIAMHFFSRAPEFLGLASNPSVAFAHLLAQIFAVGEIRWVRQKPLQHFQESKSHGEPKLFLPETQTERANLLYETVANLKLPKGKRFLVLIDGIDEADEPFPPPFPTQLPDGVFVVVSARWDGHSEMPYLRGWNFDEQIELSLMETDEIAEWLKCYGEGELKPLAKDGEFIAKLKHATDGLPLFLRFVLDDLAEKVRRGGEVGEFEVPRGFSAYVSEQVQRIVASSQDGIPLTDLVALLAIAKGAIRQDEIAQVLSIPVEALSHLPNIIARWLRINPLPITHLTTCPSARLLSFAFTHPLLSSEFAKVMGKKAKEVEVRLIDWCSKWREHKSEYALRYFDEHLRGVGEFEKLWALAMDDEWAQIHSEIFPDEPELPLKAVRNGLAAAIESEDAVTMAKMLLRHVELLGKMENPMKALRRGKLERALKLAALAMEQDASIGTICHLALASVWHQQGEFGSARRALKQLLQIWRFSIPPANLCFRLLKPLHDSPEAVEVAKLVFTEPWRRNLAKFWSMKGMWEQALELVRSIEDTFHKSTALSDIAVEMAKIGKIGEVKRLFAEAKQQAIAVKDSLTQSHALLILLKSVWHAGLEEEARKIVNEIVKFALKTDAQASIEVLTELAEFLLEQGETKQVEDCLNLAKGRMSEVEDDDLQFGALGEIAQILVLMERRGEAEGIVNQIVSEHPRIRPFCCAVSLLKIAEAALKVGQQGWAKELAWKATEVAENIIDKTERVWALSRIAEFLAKLGLLEDAKLLAAKGKGSWERSETWLGVMEGLIKLKRHEEAIELTGNIEGIYWRRTALRELAKAAKRDGKNDLAEQVFEQAKNLIAQSHDLMEIAADQMEVGLFWEALATLEQALELWRKEKQEERWSALRTIVEVLAEQGKMEDAERVARAINNSWQKANALWKIALNFAEMGRKREAEIALRQATSLAIFSDDACEYDLCDFFSCIFTDALQLSWHEAIDIVLSEIALKHPAFADEVKEIATKVAAEKGLVSKAFELAQSITEPQSRAWALIAVSKAFAEIGEREQAKQFLEEAWQLSEQAHGSVACIRNEVVKELARSDEWEKALQRLESLRGGREDWQDAIRFLSKEAARQGKADLAEQIAGKCRQVDFRATVWTDLVEAFGKAGMEGEARKAFERAKRLAMKCRDSDEAISYLAEAIATLGWVEEAQNLLDKIESEEGREKAIYNIVFALLEEGKTELAEFFARQSLSAEVWSELGVIWAKAGEREKAKVAFEKALSLAKGSWIEGVAVSMIEAGFSDEGVKLLEGRHLLDEWTLQDVLNELASQNDRKNFLKLLPQCRLNLRLAHKACGLLASLYPEQATAIAHAILQV